MRERVRGGALRIGNTPGGVANIGKETNPKFTPPGIPSVRDDNLARYTDEFRAQSIVMLEAAGWPDRKGALTCVAQTLGIKYQTLGRWARAQYNPPPNKTVHVKAFNLIEAIRLEVQAILEDMPNARPDADFKELGTVAGILIDKLQLLEGKATERIEMLTDDERAERINAILDAARERRANASSEFMQ